MWIYLTIALIILLFLYVFITYNRLVTYKNRVEEAFSTMDVYLKKRWDLIPNLVETVKGYVKHEKETLQEIVSLRNTVYEDMNTSNKIAINEDLTPKVNKLMALSEAYPDLKANTNFIDLSDKLRQIEDDIANARKYYNGCVRIMNNKVQMIPSNIIAKVFGFKSYKMFEAEDKERENVKIEL